MHYQTVNKHLKNIRVAQREMRNIQEGTQRHNPEVAQKAGEIDKMLEELLDELLKVDYEH